MADKVDEYSTSKIPSKGMAQTIDEIIQTFKNARKPFERRNYDNNFFDDGYHYRYLQRTTNRIIDLSEQASQYSPMRAIPKASRQIRGVVNLLMQNRYKAIVYPESVSRSQYPDVAGVDPDTGQQIMQTNPQFIQAQQIARNIALRTGHWLDKIEKEQNLFSKDALMGILAAKHGVSFMQIWPDAVKEKIITQVYDFFDIYVDGFLTEIYDSPAIIKAIPTFISQIVANENYDEQAKTHLMPDNRYASSEVKEAYMNARYGKQGMTASAATLLVKEAFMKEYLNEDNMFRIATQNDAHEILQNRQKGDLVIRQVITAGGELLRDRYVALQEYPFVDLRFEPGPVYQVPLIERFIPMNKSLDAIVSRTERYIHSTPMGVYLKRQGEQFQITNQSGAQVIEYQNTPPAQQTIAPIPQFIFEMLNYIGGLIEEQGVTTTTLGKLPEGVKANAAIESLKESELTNLVVASEQYKLMVKRRAERFIELADKYFVTPQDVKMLNQGVPDYFQIIGLSALQERQKLGIGTPGDVIPISRDSHVEIETESSLGYTREGKRAAAMDLANFLAPMVQQGFIPPEAFKQFLQELLKTYEYGNLQDFMQAMDEYMSQGSMTDDQIQAIKVAMAETMSDLIKQGAFPDQEDRIMENKIGVVEGLKDAGLVNKQKPADPPKVSIAFKDLPPEGQAQAAAEAGIHITPEHVVNSQKMQMKMSKGGKNGSSNRSTA